MPTRRLRVPPLDFDAIRTELEVPEAFPPEVEAAAAEAAARPPVAAFDATEIPLVTVDPPGSLDLDQALHIERRAGGYRLHYAIADVAAFVDPGGPVDAEARVRGETRYSPDRRTPLHPTVLAEGAASLLPGEERPAVLWRIDMDVDGTERGVSVRRALVRSRAKLDYRGLQASLDAGRVPEAAELLPVVGRLRQAIAVERDALELGLPDQEVVPAGDGTWTLAFRAQLPVERWNAQLSLLTGMAAAQLMLDARVGVLRTLPPADAGATARVMRGARALGVDWPDGAGPADVVGALDASRPAHAALLDLAAELLRGAGYTAFDGTVPDQVGHAGVGAPYAHVTAPIRRLVDRFATEVCLAAGGDGDDEVPAWAREGLAAMPELMAASHQRAGALERAILDHTEAWLLASRVGQVFAATVVDVEGDGDRGTIVLDDPAVRARCDGAGPTLGSRIDVRLVEADPATRRVRFTPA